MVVIFAGCDCTGKSTYASMMDKGIWKIKKGTVNNDLRAAIDELETSIKNNDNILYDRIPLIDDIVYSRVFSKKDSVLIEEKDRIHNLLSHCCIIYFMCDTYIIKERLRKRGDKYIIESQIPEIKKGYRKAFSLLDIHPHTVDTTRSRKETILKHIMGVIKNEELKNS